MAEEQGENEFEVYLIFLIFALSKFDKLGSYLGFSFKMFNIGGDEELQKNGWDSERRNTRDSPWDGKNPGEKNLDYEWFHNP